MAQRRTKKLATRQRILEAATEAYAEHGYRNARVREICDRANANIAAVNYHFGDKFQLYEAALRNAFFSISGPDPTSWDEQRAAPPATRLHSFVRTLLTQLLGSSGSRSDLYVRLMTREMADPTAALERVIEEGIGPQVLLVQAIVREVLGSAATDAEVRRSAGSIMGQCLHYHFARAVIEHMKLESKFDSKTIEALAEHITTFSMAGLERVAERSRGRASPDSP